MGAGKTTFIHHLCDYLGVEDAVSSPTFALINEYHFLNNGQDKTIYHMDWYRINSEEEAINAGIEDALLNKDAYCFVEWPEKAIHLLPQPYLWIEIEVLDETKRKMTVSKNANFL
jgi:tRNA threonylcarbamoyladenosine biosynthesis protein TsaE